MSRLVAPAGQHGNVAVLPGPRLFAHLADGPGLTAHRGRMRAGHAQSMQAQSTRASSRAESPRPRSRPDWSAPVWPSHAGALAELLESIDLRGRGGAAFPIARKIRTAATSRGTPVVVVNAAEGEPASAKDSTLMLLVPHLVLDGAQMVALALNASAVHVVVPGERPAVEQAVLRALRERAHTGDIPMTLHRAECRFVAGESSAVLELLAGRPNLPVTTSKPSAVSGLGGQPTVLSNAETYAQAALLVRDGAEAYRSVGTPAEPGTRLLTIDGDGAQPTVLEVAHGAALDSVLAAVDADAGGGLLLGGYHGTWVGPEVVDHLTVSPAAITAAGAAIGAGIVLPLAVGQCPVRRTAAIVSYLAGESANRCGPCRFGLPALGDAMREVALGTVATTARLEQLMTTVEGRGACHHPDGTTRSIRSLLRVFPAEVEAHLRGACGATPSWDDFDSGTDFDLVGVS